MGLTKKNALMLIAIIIVAAMFIGGIGSGSAPKKSSTTTISAQYLVTGTTNATVENYSKNLIIYAPQASSSYNSIISKLTTLQNNGSVSDYNNFGNQINILAGNSTAYWIYNTLYNISNSIQANGTTYVSLPSTLTVQLSGSSVRIYVPNKIYVLHGSSIYPIGTVLNVSIQAFVTSNGTVFNNSIRIIPAG